MRAERHAMQPVALAENPLIVAVLIELESFEKIAGVDLDGMTQRLFAAGRHTGFELHHVAGDALRIEGEEIVFLDQHRFVSSDRLQLAPQRRQHLAQTLPRLLRSETSPEQRGDLVARDELRRLDREIREQRLCFFRRDRDQTAAGDQTKVAEQFQAQCCHSRRIIAGYAGKRAMPNDTLDTKLRQTISDQNWRELRDTLIELH